MIRPISISLSPNTEKDDVFLAFKLIFKPGQWKKGLAARELEEQFREYLGVKYAFSFNSGRSALLAILNVLNLEKNDEVLLQAFTCNAAVNPIIWSGLKPVFVDCREDDFNINPKDLERKIFKKTKVIMVQHTFGLPADMDKVLGVVRQNNLILIEDCAHSLGAEYKGQKTGTFGKAAFFSFGRDKVISSVYGGMVVTNDDDLAKKIKTLQEKIKYPSRGWILQQLLHPVLMNWLTIPTYSILGKYLLVLLQLLGIMSKAVHPKEKKGLKPSYFPKKMPNALALLSLNQFKKLEKFNNHRQKIAELYFDNLKNSSFLLPEIFSDRKSIFLRFVVRQKGAHRIIKMAWQKNLLIGDWYTFPIGPAGTDFKKIGYEIGDCPTAEKLADTTFNLPTHINISEKDAKIIADFLRKLL